MQFKKLQQIYIIVAILSGISCLVLFTIFVREHIGAYFIIPFVICALSIMNATITQKAFSEAAIDYNAKSLIYKGKKYYYQCSYYNTYFSEEDENIGVINLKLFVLFGKTIQHVYRPISFVGNFNVESPDITKEKLKSRMEELLTRREREKEIKKGNLIEPIEDDDKW
jgi:hypothetical protein